VNDFGVPEAYPPEKHYDHDEKGWTEVVSGPLRQYQIEHDKHLAEQAQRSAEEQEKVRAAAKADLEKHRAERKQKAEKALIANREEEEETRKSLQAALKEGDNSWERIVSLIDLKAGKTGEKDVSRMRKILIDKKAAQHK